MLIRIKIFYSNLISNSKALQLFSHREHNHSISVFWLQLQKCGKDNPKKTKESKQEVKQEVLGSIKEKKSYKTNGVNK